MDRLIETVRVHPELYDVCNTAYKDNVKKLTVWSAIAEELDLPSGESARAKWRNVRDSYVKYLRSLKKKPVHGPKKYRKWPWANQMEFLKPHLNEKKTESNSPQDNDSQMYSEEEEDGSADSFFNAFDFLDTVNINEVPEQPRKKFKACGVADRALLSFHSKNLVKQEMDAVDLLFLSHALTLKTFTKKRQMLTKMKISQIMMEAEMEELNDEPGPLSEQI